MLRPVIDLLHLGREFHRSRPSLRSRLIPAVHHRLHALILLAVLFGVLTGPVWAGKRELPASGPGLVRLTERVWAWVARDERSSNGALFVGRDAALIVDPGLTPGIAREFLGAARKVTDRPIRYAVLTHWHPDHSFGSVCLPNREFSLIAHPLTRRALAERGAAARHGLESSASGELERKEFADCRLALPDHVVIHRQVFDLGYHNVEVFPVGPAHTAGDLAVWSPQERVLVTGDLLLTDSSPFLGDGDIGGWLDALDRLLKLRPDHVIPGHFAVASQVELKRFRDYLATLKSQVESLLSSGVPLERIPRRVDMSKFASFRQYPQYGATFAENARVVARRLADRPAEAGQTEGFRVVKVLDVGRNPHQIAFSADGRTAYVAAAGSDQISVVDVESRQVKGTIKVEDTPLGIAVLPGDRGLAVSRFRSDRISLLNPNDGRLEKNLVTGGAPSLLVGPLPTGKYLVSVEEADKLWVLDGSRFELEQAFQTGDRPFPAAATSDGRLAFVPNYVAGTVTVIDLWNKCVLSSVAIGKNPSGGTLLPEDIEYAVAVRGEDRIAFINTASKKVVGELKEGIGRSPFSLVLTPDGRLGFVNNTASHDISVVEIASKRVVARIPVGKIPIVMGVHPSGKTLWVSSEGSHQLSIIDIPERWRTASTADQDRGGQVTEVAVMGMIHGRHRTSRTWGLVQVRDTIRRLAPDAICAEIPPDRWERIWSDYSERGVIEDPRIRRFPEYTDVLLPLKVELGFEVVPCAAWTKEMSDLRAARIRQFENDSRWAERNREYIERSDAVRARHREEGAAADDPHFIHSDRYDRQTREELSIYDEYLNEWIGPGGWTHINEAHMRLIDEAIKSHRGKRLLITFGAGHKYWILDHLRDRRDVRLLSVSPYLPARTGNR